MDLERFLTRTGKKQKELAEELGITPGMVTALKKGRSEPSYSVCRSLLLAGMTIGELFGDEVQKRNNSSLSPSLSDEECRAIVERGMSTLGRR